MKIVDTKKENGVPFNAVCPGHICRIDDEEDGVPIYAMKIDCIEDSNYHIYNAIDLENGELLNIATSKKVIPLETELHII